MLIQLNGKARELPGNWSAGQLVGDLQLTGRRIAMEINGEILPRSKYDEHRFAEGDNVEIVHAVGGG